MAADTTTHYNSGSSGPNQRKIVVCGNGFLCGMGGYSPIDAEQNGHVLKYEFQSWIASIKVGGHPSVNEFASAIQIQAWQTFREMDFFLKEDEYWKAQSAPMEFMSYAIAGYSGNALEICTIAIEINWDNRTLKYPATNCTRPAFTSDTSFRYYPLRNTFHWHMDKILLADETPEKTAYLNSLPPNISIAKTLFSSAPPAIQKLTAIAATYIEVESKFSPDQVSGTPIVGVIVKGQFPTISQFATN